MNIESFSSEDATIQLKKEELVIINNALNEVCNFLDVNEFSLRMGAELNEVEELLRQISSQLNQMEHDK